MTPSSENGDPADPVGPRDPPSGQTPPGKGVDEALARWITGLGPDGPAVASRDALMRDEGTIALLAGLRAQGSSELADRLVGLVPPDAVVGEATAADEIVGRAAGVATAALPDAMAIRRAGALLSLFPSALDAFDEAIDAALSMSPTALSRLAATLLETATTFGTTTGSGFLPGDLAVLARLRRSVPSIENRWSEARWYPGWIRRTFAFDALRRASPADYLEVLEGFQDAEPVRQILESARLNAVALADLLRIARPAFDGAGIWSPNAKAATLLLGLATEALVSEPVGDDADERFRIGSEAVFDALAARSDRRELGFAWANWIVSQGDGVAGRDVVPRRSRELALLGRLAEVVGDHPAPLEWVRAARDPWRRPRLVAALLPLCRDDRIASGDALNLIEAAAREGVFDLTAIASSGFGGRPIESAVVAYALRSVPDLASRATAAWRRLMSMRDRTRYWRSQVIGNPPSPGLFLAHWLMNPLLDLVGRSIDARDLWLALAEIAREGRLTERHLPNDLEGWPFVLGGLAAAWPRIFRDRPTPGQSGNLADFLHPYAVADEPFLGISLALHRNGASAWEIAAACGGPDRLFRLLTAVAEDRRDRMTFARMEYQDPELDTLLTELRTV